MVIVFSSPHITRSRRVIGAARIRFIGQVDLVDEQNICRWERQPRRPIFGLGEQQLLPLFELLGRDCFNPGSLAIAVFDNCDTRCNGAAIQNLTGDAAYDLAKAVVFDCPMVNLLATKPHAINGRQVFRNRGPMVALIFGHPQRTGRTAHGQHLALVVDVQRVPVY